MTCPGCLKSPGRLAASSDRIAGEVISRIVAVETASLAVWLGYCTFDDIALSLIKLAQSARQHAEVAMYEAEGLAV